jgi:hypothetical protein
MRYPPKLTVVVPQFRVVVDENKRAYSNRLVFLPAFAALHVIRQADGRLAFHERVEIDPIGDRTIDLLTLLGDEIDPEATLAGWRLDRQLASFVRLPRDTDRDDEGKAPLMRFWLALTNRPIDVGWYDRTGGLPTLIRTALRHGLPAEWGSGPSANPAMLRRLLRARVRAVWAAIADKLLEEGEARRKAFTSFEMFNSKGDEIN